MNLLPVAYHNEAPIIQGVGFAPILGGASLHHPKTWAKSLLRDDVGEHISQLNPYLSELTALYSAWKNHPEWTYYGIVHYRRFFLSRPSWSQRWLVQPECRPWAELDKWTPHLALQPEDLCGHALIVSTTRTYRDSLRTDYLRWHDARDLEVLEDAMDRHHPGLRTEWNYFLAKEHDLTPYNMMYGTRNEVNRYCEWLFPMLLDANEQLNLEPNKGTFRKAGFLAERLFSFYLHHERISVRRLPVVQFGQHRADRYPLLHGAYDWLKRR